MRLYMYVMRLEEIPDRESLHSLFGPSGETVEFVGCLRDPAVLKLVLITSFVSRSASLERESRHLRLGDLPSADLTLFGPFHVVVIKRRCILLR